MGDDRHILDLIAKKDADHILDVGKVDAEIAALEKVIESVKLDSAAIHELSGRQADEIAALKEELRLAVLRGDLLDKEIEEDMKREAALKAELQVTKVGAGNLFREKDYKIGELEADVQKWIRIAGENQKSANKSAEAAEKAEARIKELEKFNSVLKDALEESAPNLILKGKLEDKQARIKELEDGLFEMTSKMAEGTTEDRGPEND